MAIQTIHGQATQHIFDGITTKAARRVPLALHRKAGRLLDQIDSAGRLGDLALPPGNHLESLAGDRKGFHSIRINRQWRIVFRWEDEGVFDVEIIDYH
jgi:proteic killer suppression protein